MCEKRLKETIHLIWFLNFERISFMIMVGVHQKQLLTPASLAEPRQQPSQSLDTYTLTLWENLTRVIAFFTFMTKL